MQKLHFTVAVRSALTAIAVMAAGDVRDASAQTGSYMSAAGLADIKQFDSVEYDPRVVAIGGADASLDGTAAGGGFRVGTFLHPNWSIELGIEAESRTTKAFPNPYELLPTRSSTLRLPETSGSTAFVTVNTVVGFHPPKAGRVQLGYLGGFSIVRGTYRSTLPEFGVLPAQFDLVDVTGGPPGLAVGDISSAIFPPLPITTRSFRRTDLAAGALLGFEAAIDVSARFSVVPGIRTVIFSNLGQSVFLIRPEVGARWAFGR